MSPEPGETTVRAFVALPLDPVARARIADAVAPLRERLRGVRWSAAATFHVTLRFLGDASRDVLERLAEPLARAAGRCPPGRARLPGLGVFPERGAPRVLWLGLDAGPGVMELQAACERAAVDEGFAPEEKAFRPHLTLGRWRGRARRPELPVLDLGGLGDLALERLSLFASELHPTGARHTELRSWPLGGEGA